ncbi:cadmium-translocating P-type ATPase [Veillonellaceae bacterium M2-8]|uniref:heavy metal translocating P-type ATPase n=1 Tax=uncultured Megasphaera sp. TaxID=165188 RepID=UPI0012E213A0|nr:heavy metal translocating P-type ATPase [uncultured Megasphaera sp.]MUP48130.1 cadmium-translocating P-type ATPase [Veillonellaceae bacterium M2-8]MUP58432.1 cadmium-translocating P-type ATPase [Veillonellaceae bacterium M2-4]
MNSKQKKMVVRIIVTAIWLIGLHIVPITGIARLFAYIIPYIIIGGDIVCKALRGIRNRQVFDENFLLAVATIGAFMLAVYRVGDYTEAVAVMLFYQVGELFQGYAVGKSRKNISDLMDIRPDYANIEKDGEICKVDPDEVAIGSYIIVLPGEKVPLDGVVVEGKSMLNTSALTGESVPREASKDVEVMSGCINLTGLLKIKTTKEFEESTASKILELVENASSRKSKSEAFISKFARVYTPAVCYSALALAILPPLIRVLVLSIEPMWTEWIYRALTFLVISCPCALVISIPLSFFAGIGGASKAGILIKGSNYLETLAKTEITVFDKTGTLTAGTFEVQGVHHSTLEDNKILEFAALAECASSHPISLSLKKAYGKVIDMKRVTQIEEISGNGVTAIVDGIPVAIGNEKMMNAIGVKAILCHAIGTIIHVAINGEYAGHIVISDTIKVESKMAIDALKQRGVKKTVMLTGDIRPVAEKTATQLGMDAVYSDLLPADKVQKVEELLQPLQGKGKLAFIGDGINDAPVLSRADIGIAMGAMGSDAAIEAADVVLMDDDPRKVASAIGIAKKCLRIVYQNIYFAIGIKLLCLLLGALGVANMWLAIFADVGVMIIAILNATRTLFINDLLYTDID